MEEGEEEQEEEQKEPPVISQSLDCKEFVSKLYAKWRCRITLFTSGCPFEKRRAPIESNRINLNNSLTLLYYMKN